MKNFRTLLTKLTSRKFIISVIPTIAALFAYFGADDNTVQMIASATIIVASTVSYVIVEGRVDAKGIASTITDIVEAVGDITPDTANTNYTKIPETQVPQESPSNQPITNVTPTETNKNY